MRSISQLFIAISLITTTASAQTTEILDYCNCVDNVGQINPAPDGKFERTCKGKVIETGLFKNGSKDGEWITYDQKGIIIRKISYTNGKLNGKSELFLIMGAPS